MDISKIIKRCFPKEDKIYASELKELNKQLTILQESRNKLEARCTHPKKYIKVHNDGHDIPDGWGGSDYSGDMYRASCTLCGKYNVGNLEPEKFNGIRNLKGSPEIVASYKKECAKIEKGRIAISKKFEKDRELKQLESLKQKYEN